MNKEKILVYLLHYGIIIWTLSTILNSAYQMTFVYTVEGYSLTLLGASSQLDYETMMIRRAYALEAWVATMGLAIYLALTEIMPRMKKFREERENNN